MSHTTLETNDARQAERKPGMLPVLILSTALAAATIGVTFAVLATTGTV